MGATTSVFPYTQSMAEYLVSTNRSHVAREASIVNDSTGFLGADLDAEYDRVVEVDLGEVEPRLNGPFTPDISTRVSDMGNFVRREKHPVQISAALIGSCTNSSYEDLSRSANLVEQASKAGLKPVVPLYITPGSEQIRATVERDGMLGVFENVGGVVLGNACGPCIGQWRRDDASEGKDNSIVTSFNRNFRGRNDGNAKTRNFLASPEVRFLSVCFSFA